MTREHLIKHVWEEYGFSPSSATLSNHISELRKAFETLGMSKNILITVPRIGFKMEAEIHPETKDSKESTTTDKIENIPSSHDPDGNTTLSLIDAGSSKNPIRMKILIFMTISLIAIAIASDYLTKDVEPMLIGIKDKCKIYALDGNQQGIEQLNDAKKMLASVGVDCTKLDSNIYYMEARQSNELLNVHFIAACAKKDNLSYKNCNNYKSVE